MKIIGALLTGSLRRGETPYKSHPIQGILVEEEEKGIKYAVILDPHERNEEGKILAKVIEVEDYLKDELKRSYAPSVQKPLDNIEINLANLMHSLQRMDKKLAEISK